MADDQEKRLAILEKAQAEIKKVVKNLKEAKKAASITSTEIEKADKKK